ncbi:uncharacterized protein LOC126795118 [Argentina anserina]|uniref:uncharacterized protein LOC126795118 n=1 Tax=Argentina anserina TaxID=57926 RepID=UPI00217651F7|nr:uncharacterized protein LOC126795118 [Potentilla anserina]
MEGENLFNPEGLEFKKKKKKNKWSMVAIRDSNSSSIFPPINHENLHLPTSPSLSSSSSSSLSSFSPSDSDESGPVPPKKNPDARVSKCGESRSWAGFGFGLLRARVLGIAWGKAWSFGCGVSVVAAMFVVCSFYLRARQRRYRRRCDLVIKERDEKINKLLHQIAQMNEVLVARHRVLASKLAD